MGRDPVKEFVRRKLSPLIERMRKILSENIESEVEDMMASTTLSADTADEIEDIMIEAYLLGYKDGWSMHEAKLNEELMNKRMTKDKTKTHDYLR